MERHMVGRRLELMGGGLMAVLAKPDTLAAKLRAVLHDRAYGRAAARFARKYAGVTSTQQTDAMISDIERLLGQRSVGLSK
jgi:UDP:flavonoid glycosyltransferase YjiC (YdhE family)